MLPVQFPKTGSGLVLLVAKNCALGVGMVSPSAPVTWLARGSPKLGRTTSSISPWDPGCLESGGRGLRIQGGLRARWSAESGPHLACTLIMAEWAAAPIDPLARGCPGEVILALASEELWLLASPR